MEFTVSKADLVRELGLSQGVVEKKTTIPILSNVLLEARGDRLYLTATDLELGLRTSCTARVKKEGSGTIPARKLLDYVRLLPDADITVKFAENNWANFTCGRSRTRMAGMSRESFPELPTMPEAIALLHVRLLLRVLLPGWRVNQNSHFDTIRALAMRGTPATLVVRALDLLQQASRDAERKLGGKAGAMPHGAAAT